jgi:GH24 family phage-related lysozyme (muramidase)
MSEWTKGPWETDDNMGVWATGGGMVGQFFHVSMGITLEQAEANARLAAAAPTMACESVAADGRVTVMVVFVTR